MGLFSHFSLIHDGLLIVYLLIRRVIQEIERVTSNATHTHDIVLKSWRFRLATK